MTLSMSKPGHLVAALLLALAVTTAAAAPPNAGPWLQELTGAAATGFTAYPNNLGWQADHPESYPAPFLVVGVRPEGDRPEADIKVRGEKRQPGDWVVSDGTGAIWVRGLPAPVPGQPVVLAGRFTRADGSLALQGSRFLVPGVARGKTVAHAGDFIYYPLAASKGSSCPVQVEGDAAAVAFTDERDALVIRALKPGTARIKLFYSGGFLDDQLTPAGEHLLVVE